MNTSIIWFVTINQFITAIFLLLTPTPIRVASLGIFYDIFPVPQLGALLMLLTVILSVIGVVLVTNLRLRFLFFIPQLIFLFLTSGSALNYIIQGHYADGVIRPWQFIFIDQFHPLLATIFYMSAIFNFRKGSKYAS